MQPQPEVQAPPCAACAEVLHRRILERQVGLHPFQAAALVFHFLQPFHVGGLQPTIRGCPLVVRRGADAPRFARSHGRRDRHRLL